MSQRIREATAADIPGLFEVWKTAVDATHDFLSEGDLAQIAAFVREEYLPAADLDVVVDEGDNPLAFMGITEHEIDSLFVHANARGLGLGRQLVETAFRRAPIICTEVNEQNHQAIAFWKHMGFQVKGWSATDRQGRPYPLLYMERADRTRGLTKR